MDEEKYVRIAKAAARRAVESLEKGAVSLARMDIRNALEALEALQKISGK
jgi:hypothetical protein